MKHSEVRELFILKVIPDQLERGRVCIRIRFQLLGQFFLGAPAAFVNFFEIQGKGALGLSTVDPAEFHTGIIACIEFE